MSAVLLFGIFFALLFLNVPIAMSLGVSSIILIYVKLHIN